MLLVRDFGDGLEPRNKELGIFFQTQHSAGHGDLPLRRCQRAENSQGSLLTGLSLVTAHFLGLGAFGGRQRQEEVRTKELPPKILLQHLEGASCMSHVGSSNNL